jgi:hypothetical protein
MTAQLKNCHETFSGPLYREATPEGGSLRVYLINAKGVELVGFEIAGEYRQFHAATARVNGDTVVVRRVMLAGQCMCDTHGQRRR